MATGSWRRGVVAGVVVAAVAAALVFLPVASSIERLIEWIRGAGVAGVVVFTVAYVLATVLVLPGAVLTLGAGFAYGPLLGTLLVSPVSVLAATVAFALGRTTARDWIVARVSGDPRFAAVDAAIGREGFKIVFLLRLSPVFPFSILNYALGVTRVRPRDFILGSFIGMLPATAMYVYVGSLVTTAASLGSSTSAADTPRQVLYWAGLGATVLVTVVITRLARRALQAELAAGEPPESPSPS